MLLFNSSPLIVRFLAYTIPDKTVKVFLFVMFVCSRMALLNQLFGSQSDEGAC
jgi:hypothetical protein